MSDRDAPVDVYAAGLFPVCAQTHDVGLRRLFDLSTLLLLLDCRPGDRVLDLGAGSGFSSEMLARFGYDAVALDPDVPALRHARARPAYDRSRIAGTVTVTAGAAERLPFREATFDGVLGMNVLHHLADLEGAIRELGRVLKPGARAVVCEPGLDHLLDAETRRARQEHGEDDRAFDVLAFLRTALTLGFSEAMLTATLQSPLRLLPVQELDLYLSGRHPRPHMTPAGVIEELQRRHPFAMLVREGAKPRTSQHPGRLAAQIAVAGIPATAAIGQRIRFRVQARNTGDTLWLATPTSRGGYVSLGCKWLAADSGRLVADHLGRTRLTSDVAPGGEAIVDVDFELPPSLPAGDYTVRVDLVDELICWFSDIPGNAASAHRVTVTR